MTEPADARLRIGAWCVDPTAGQISRDGETVRLDARTLRLLLDLAEHAGEVVSLDALLERVWAGFIVTPDSVYQAVTTLRRLLGDDPRRPTYIATVPRLGYRLIAPVRPWREAATPARPSRRAIAAAAAAAATAIAAGLFAYQRLSLGGQAPRPTAVAVLAFLDMTPTMDQEPLADDVTEGLIDRLSKNPALRTPSFRAALQLKGKHASVAQAARLLGVAYVVDGTSRKEGARIRVAARLIRADTGFVVWSQTYERPLADVPAIQDAAAAGVSAALQPAGRR